MFLCRAKRGWDESFSSDCLAMLAAYRTWMDVKHRNRYSHMRDWEQSWCKRNFLSRRTLNEVAELVTELTKRLANFNIKPTRNLNT